MKQNLIIYYTIIILGVSTYSFMSVGVYDHAAHGQIRDDTFEDKIDQANRDILILDVKIEKQNEKIREKDLLIDEKKEALRELRDEIKKENNESFDPILWIKAAEKRIEEAKTEYQNARDQLKLYITERSNLFKLIKETQKELEINLKSFKFESTNQTKLIGIELSRSCLAMNQFANSSCPTYEDLFILDTSLQEVSGKFVNGSRQPSPYKESWRFYDGDEKLRIIINPPLGMSDKIKMIHLVSSLDTYTLQSDMGNGTDRVLFHDRYIEKCRTATISADKWLHLIPITIFDLRNNCESSSFKERQVIPFNKTDIDITTSPNWQAKQQLELNKEKCKGLCFEY